MALPLNLIAEYLSDFSFDLLVAQPDRDFEFSRIQMLSPGYTGELEDDVLYVSEPKTLYRLPKSKFRDHFFVFRAKMQTIERYQQYINAFVIDEAHPIGEIINRLLELFMRVDSIGHELERAVLRGGGFEPIMAIARKMFSDSVLLMVDSAYNIIAATDDKCDGNTYVDNLLRQKFYGKEAIDSMAEKGYFDDGEKYLRPVLVKEHSICGCPVMLRGYHENGSFFSFVAYYSFTHVPTLLEQFFFNMLTEQLDKYYRESGFYDNSMPKRQQIINDLITASDPSEGFITDRCKALKVPAHGSFRLVYIPLDGKRTIKASHLTIQLSAWCSLPHYGVFQYENSVIVLLHDWHDCGVAEQMNFREHWEDMMNIIESNHGVAGVSLLFTTMAKFGSAFRQAETAIRLGQKLSFGKREYHYSKYYIDDMLTQYEKKFSLGDIYVQYLNKLGSESVGSYSNLTLLYYYISSERNISLTAKRVHMHRNSIIYRLRKIQDTLEMDLDDPDVRLRLMISFKILELTGRLTLQDGSMEIDSGEQGGDKLRLIE